MKVAILLLIAHSAVAAETNDVRIVGGRKVNLGPVNVWLATQQGPRPLPHWKDLEVNSVGKDVFAEQVLCGVKGWRELIYIRNLPLMVSMGIERIEAEQKKYRELEKKIERDEGFVAAAYASDRKLADQNLEVKMRERQAKQDRIELNLMLDFIKWKMKDTHVLAMFTGERDELSKFQIWDCGKPVE